MTDRDFIAFDAIDGATNTSFEVAVQKRDVCHLKACKEDERAPQGARTRVVCNLTSTGPTFFYTAVPVYSMAYTLGCDFMGAVE